ncbi:TMEM236 [Branchiostoma lanceolatum]|uniref:TMEM236 protein n=1 Tax=Branchiostoma lanceolatum TaxID=7740 RepID=A0A8J9YTZ2_BRALA|nr:TMEM236 [Branchiostoma lanceolatum]
MYTPNGGTATVQNGRASTASEYHLPPRRQIRVTKVKVINFLLELCQWSSLAIPIFVTSEGVARTVDRVEARNTTSGTEQAGGRGAELPYYWLLVAASIAYVATVTLLIYLPVKYCFMWKNRFLLENAKWLPAILMHLLLSVLPCMSLMLFGIKLQDDENEVAALFDTYTDFAAPLVVLGVLVTSWVEKVRRFPSVNSAGAEMTEGPTSPRSMVNPVYTIDGADGSQSTDEQTPRDPPGTNTPNTPVSIRRSFPMSFSSRTSPRPRPKLTSNDDRARILSIEFFAVYDVSFAPFLSAIV